MTAGAVITDGSLRVGVTVELPGRRVEHWKQWAGEQIISQVELGALLAINGIAGISSKTAESFPGLSVSLQDFAPSRPPAPQEP